MSYQDEKTISWPDEKPKKQPPKRQVEAVVISRLIERWREEEKILDDEIYFLIEHRFEFERKVKESIRAVVSRRRMEIEEILGL